MTVLVANSLGEVLDALAADPTATLLAGGTDLMVEVNEGHRRFPGGDDALVIALAGVPELSSWTVDEASRSLTLGAGVRWNEIEHEPLRAMVPALAEAAAIAAVDWGTGVISATDAARAGELAAAASRPIDDHRSTAAYRRHAVGVMVRRLLQRAFAGAPAEAESA